MPVLFSHTLSISLHLAAFAGLLAMDLVGPGLFLIRWLRWDPRETLCASLGLSLVLLFIASFVIHETGLPATASHGAVSLGCLVLSMACRRDILRLARHRQLRRQCVAFGGLCAWALLLLALVRHYSGGLYAGDWLEHYGRTRFFLGQRLEDMRFMEHFTLPARPPLMNLLAGHFLAQVGDEFEICQVIFLILNLLIYFPLVLFLPAFGARTRCGRILLTGFLMANPLLMQNVTWTWTKAFTGFFVLLGLWLYLTGWRRGKPARMMGAALSLSAGFLAHFSAGPYAACLALHYAIAVFPRRVAHWREVAAMTLVTVLVLGSWFGWSAARYGVSVTIGSNTTAAALRGESLPAALAKVARNLVYSFVPHPLHLPRGEFDALFQQPSRLGYWRDYIFYFYQSNFVFSQGIVGGPLVLFLLFRAFRTGTGPKKERRFWLGFIVLSGLLGLAAHPSADPFGVAHICGQPLILLGVAFLAARYGTLPRAVQWLGLAGCLIDFAAGILLHFSLENRVFQVEFLDSVLRFPEPAGHLSTRGVLNYAAKLAAGVTYIGDHFNAVSGLVVALILGAFYFALRQMAGCVRCSPPVEQRNQGCG
jgi:hypothetical protein